MRILCEDLVIIALLNRNHTRSTLLLLDSTLILECLGGCFNLVDLLLAETLAFKPARGELLLSMLLLVVEFVDLACRFAHYWAVIDGAIDDLTMVHGGLGLIYHVTMVFVGALIGAHFAQRNFPLARLLSLLNGKCLSILSINTLGFPSVLLLLFQDEGRFGDFILRPFPKLEKTFILCEWICFVRWGMSFVHWAFPLLDESLILAWYLRLV